MDQFPVAEKAVRMVFVRRRKLTQCVLFMLSPVWVCLFPLVCISSGELKTRGTYLSENALMPGSSQSSVNRNAMALADKFDAQLKENFESEVMKLFKSNGATQAFVHEYNHSTTRIGKNYVAALRPSVGGDRREAIVLIADLPTYATSDVHQQTYCCSGVAVMLTVLHSIQNVNWLSKNVIILVPETEFGITRFMEDYYQNKDGLAASMGVGQLSVGLIVRLQRPKTRKLSEVTVATQGLNGQLPNLDLFNVVTYVLRDNFVMDANYGTAVDRDSLHRVMASLVDDKSLIQRGVDYLMKMENVLRFMYRLGFSPSGWHTHLLPYRVDALSFIARESNTTGKDSQHVALAIAFAVEQTMRSISNLEEKLHQSYYQYILPSKQSFVSINEYAGPMVLSLTPIIADAIYFYIREKTDTPGQSDVLDGVLYALAALAIALASGGLLLSVSTIDVKMFPEDSCEMLGMKWIVWTGVSAVLYISFAFVPTKLGAGASMRNTWEYLKVVLYIFVFMMFTVLGVLNFPFAFTIALVTVPLYRIVVPSTGFKRLLLLTYWCFTSPIMALCGFQLLLGNEHQFWLEPENTGCITLGETGNPFLKGFGMLLSGYSRYGAFHFPLLCCILTPAHVLALMVLFAKEDPLPHRKVD